MFVHRQVASISDNNNLTGRHGQLIAAMTQDTKTDYTKEAKLLLGAVKVLFFIDGLHDSAVSLCHRQCTFKGM